MNSHISPHEDERAIHALLSEHARLPASADDEAFLNELEAKLDAESLAAAPVVRTLSGWSIRRQVWLAAAACLAVGLTAFWWMEQQRNPGLLTVTSAEVEAKLLPDREPEGQPDLLGPLAVPLEKAKREQNQRPQTLLAEVTTIAPTSSSPARIDRALHTIEPRSRAIEIPGLRRQTVPQLLPRIQSRDTSRYEAAPQNPFVSVVQQPLSTFSIDVDTASYANIRQQLSSGRPVPPAMVRVEEMLNYFTYDYPRPKAGEPLAVAVESGPCPWAPEHRLVKVALAAVEVEKAQRKAANLVFLVDVSGSMAGEDRLGRVVKNLRLLTALLQDQDSVAIVTYAGTEGLALMPTKGTDKATILAKLDTLHAGGSTNGSSGIQMAYMVAKSAFIPGGINRVILCTDGDFNAGITDQKELVQLVQTKASEGVALTVCGYGSGNLNDAMLEAITNKGDGSYHFIDSDREGRKVFQDELLGTLADVAKDVKLQLEFNPAMARSYRLIGYENRLLAAQDFANDKMDAGDIGSGHRVTALYEVVPAGSSPSADIPLKYQEKVAAPKAMPAGSAELLTVKVRYKPVEEAVVKQVSKSRLIELSFKENPEAKPSEDFLFAATVAEFGEWLQGRAKPGRSIEDLKKAAVESVSTPSRKERIQFVDLVKKAASLR
jgi:Ca-activated chloride channel homolog